MEEERNVLSREHINRLFPILQKLFRQKTEVKPVYAFYGDGMIDSVYFDCSEFIASTRMNPSPLIHNFMDSYYDDHLFSISLSNYETPYSYIIKKNEEHKIPKLKPVESESLDDEKLERLINNFFDHISEINPNEIIIKRPDHQTMGPVKDDS